MKRKVFCFLLAVLAITIFSLGCGGGGGSHSNPASPSISSTARVSGVIVDSSKKPAENVDVRLSLVPNSGLNTLPENFRAVLRLATADTQTEFNTTTDKNGVYSFENVPYGRYSLSADAGTQGAYVANLVVAAEEITVQEQKITPFGFVSGTVVTKNGNNDIQVYGAMVEACGIRAFTNNAGEFTLSHIPVGEEFGLTATLQGYTAETASFTIPATAENLTYTLPKDIELKATVVNCYSVPATVTADLTSSQFPILVIAQDTKDEKNLFYNVLKEGDASCTLRITKASTYKICAIDSTGKESKREEFSVDSEAINQNKTSESPISLAFESSTTEDKPINITLVAIPTSDYNDNTLNYYDGYVSCLVIEEQGGYPGFYYCPSDEFDYSSDPFTLEQEAAISGKFAVTCTPYAGTNENINIYSEEHESPVATISPLGSSHSLTINKLGFVPNKYLGVGYSSGCDSYKFYVDAIKYNDSDSKYNGETKRYYYGDGNELHASDIKMVMHEDDYCYMAVLYYSNQSVLNIYKVGDDSALVSYQLSNTSNPMSLKDFQVLKNGNFYVEASSSDSSGQTTVSTTAYIFSSGATSPIATSTSARRGCFVDSNNNMYRYDPSELAVVKTATLDGDPIDRYKIQTATTSGQSPTEDSVNGVLGYIETDDGIEVFVY